MATYGGFELLLRAMLNRAAYDKKEHWVGIKQFEQLAVACRLPPYERLIPPRRGRMVQARWFEGDAEPAEELMQFLMLSNGARLATAAFLVDAKPVESWPAALTLTQALRHATAHAALSASKVGEFKLGPVLRRLVDDLAAVATAALTRLCEPEESDGPPPSIAMRELVLPVPEQVEIHSLSTSADGRLLAYGVYLPDEEIGRVGVFNLPSGVSRGFIDVGVPASVILSPDGGVLTAQGAEEPDPQHPPLDRLTGLRFWNLLQPGQPAGAGEPGIGSDGELVHDGPYAFSPDGRWLAVGQNGSGHAGPTPIHLIDVATRRVASSLRGRRSSYKGQRIGNDEPYNLTFLSNPLRVVVVTWKLNLICWEAESSEVVWAYKRERPCSELYPRGIAGSPDGRLLAVSRGPDYGFNLFKVDAAGVTLKGTIRTAGQEVGSLVFSPDGRHLLLTCRGVEGQDWGFLEVFDVATRRATLSLRFRRRPDQGWQHDGSVVCLGDTDYLAVVCPDGIRVCRYLKGRRKPTALSTRLKTKRK